MDLLFDRCANSAKIAKNCKDRAEPAGQTCRQEVRFRQSAKWAARSNVYIMYWNEMYVKCNALKNMKMYAA